MNHTVIPETSARLRARISGALYVLCIGCGFFAEMIVPAKLVVYSDAVATAHNIAAAPGLYRAGFFADVSAMTLGVLSSVLPADPGRRRGISAVAADRWTKLRQMGRDRPHPDRSTRAPVSSDGLPYLLPKFTATHAGASTKAFDKAIIDGKPIDTVLLPGPSGHAEEMPLDLWILDLPE